MNLSTMHLRWPRLPRPPRRAPSSERLPVWKTRSRDFLIVSQCSGATFSYTLFPIASSTIPPDTVRLAVIIVPSRATTKMISGMFWTKERHLSSDCRNSSSVRLRSISDFSNSEILAIRRRSSKSLAWVGKHASSTSIVNPFLPNPKS